MVNIFNYKYMVFSNENEPVTKQPYLLALKAECMYCFGSSVVWLLGPYR